MLRNTACLLIVALAQAMPASIINNMTNMTRTGPGNGVQVTIIRHCEKCLKGSCTGKQDSNNCSPTGEKRAEWLPSKFHPECIVYCDEKRGCPHREHQTIEQFSAPKTACAKSSWPFGGTQKCVSGVVDRCSGGVLIAWEHKDISNLLKDLSGISKPWPRGECGPPVDRDSTQNSPSCYDFYWQFNVGDASSLRGMYQGFEDNGGNVTAI